MIAAPWNISELKILFGVRDRMILGAPEYEHEIRSAFCSERLRLAAKPRVARMLKAEAEGQEWQQHFRILMSEAWHAVKRIAADQPNPRVESAHGDYPPRVDGPEGAA